MDKLLELAERCERATGPDRKLDALIGKTIWYSTPEAVPASYAPFTTSLDAAMTLVPEGWQISDIGENWRKGDWHCTLAERPNEAQRHAYENGKTYMVDSQYGEAATAALALCAASLRARAQTPEVSNGNE